MTCNDNSEMEMGYRTGGNVENTVIRTIMHVEGKTDPAAIFSKDNNSKTLEIYHTLMSRGQLRNCS